MPFLGYFFFFFNLKTVFSKMKYKKVFIFGDLRHFPATPDVYKANFYPRVYPRVVFGHFGHFSLKAFSSKTKLKLPKLPKMPKLPKLPKFEVGPKNKRPERSLFFGKESISGV